MTETRKNNDAAAENPGASQDIATTTNEQPDTETDPVKRVTRIVLYVVAFLFIWYIMADRLAPWTDQARIQAYVIPIVPEVSGRVESINVSQNVPVKSGQLLLQIDPQDYQLAVQQAEAALQIAGQDIGAETASVSTAQAKVVEAQANLDHMLVQSKRVYEVVKKGVLPKFEADKATAAVDTAKAKIESAQAELVKAKSKLGQKGQRNPKIQSAISALKQAQLDLARTKILPHPMVALLT